MITMDLADTVRLDERFYVTCLYAIAVQVVLEYYTTFNIIVLLIRVIQMLLAARVKQYFFSQRFRQINGAIYLQVVVTALGLLYLPILVAQLFYGNMQPLFIVFVGKSKKASILEVLIFDVIIGLLFYVATKKRIPLPPKIRIYHLQKKPPCSLFFHCLRTICWPRPSKIVQNNFNQKTSGTRHCFEYIDPRGKL